MLGLCNQESPRASLVFVPRSRIMRIQGTGPSYTSRTNAEPRSICVIHRTKNSKISPPTLKGRLPSKSHGSCARFTVSQHRKRLERRVESGPRSGSEAFSIWWGEGSRRRRGRGDRGWELWILNAAWVSCKCVWGEFWLPLVLIADGQLQDPFTIRPLGDADEGGFSAWLDAADALPRRRAWSKLAERLGADSHEESKPAR